MNWLRRVRFRFHALFRREILDMRMDEEMRSHIEMQTQENVDAGMKPEEARYAAMREFGWVESVKERCRDQRGVSWVENLAQDVRYGGRMLLKSPGFTAVVVLTLAFGIGANTAIFTIINALLLRSLPVKSPADLVQVFTRSGPTQLNYSFSFPVYQKLRDAGGSLAGLFAASSIDGPTDRLMVTEAGESEFVRSQAVSGNFFQVLGVSAGLGRTLTPADDLEGNSQPVAVISYGLWQQRFAADPLVIGKTLRFDSVALTIVGVMPPSFFGFQPGENPEVWWPIQLTPQVDRDPAGRRLKAGYDSYRLIGRTAPGFNRPQAEGQLQVAFQRYQQEQAGNQEKKGSTQPEKLQLRSARSGWTDLQRQLTTPLTVLMGAVGIVLLIACANVASLLLARAAVRAREFSVRNALGANRARLVRQSLTESMLLAILGGSLGLLIAQGATRLLLAFIGVGSNSISFSLVPDARVLSFTTALAVLTGLLFGFAPALRSCRVDISATLKSTAGTMAGGGRSHKWLQALVVSQVALSLVLLVGAGLFIRTLQNLRGDTSSQWNKVIQFNVKPRDRFTPLRQRVLLRELVKHLQNAPGVQSASLYLFGMLSGAGFTQKMLPEGYAAGPQEDLQCRGVCAGARFFETLDIRLIAGREFNEQDETLAEATNSAARRILIINQSMARRYFGGTDPLGKRFFIQEQPETKYEIVGVVEDMKYRSLREYSPPTFYLPFFQESRGGPMALLVRTSGDPRPTMANLPRIVGQVDSSLSVLNMKTMSEVVNANVYQERIVAQLGTLLSLFALALACLGLYGVLSFTVVQQTREIAVRVALGALNRNVLLLVLRRGLFLVLAGSAIGLLGALIITRFASGLLYGVSGTDPITLASVFVVLLTVALCAAWFPARRATKVDPMVALRYE